MNHFNVSLGDNYYLIDRHSDAYNALREQVFGGVGMKLEEYAKYNNPFVVGKDFSMPIYLDNGNEYYIMTESGRTFENLSGLVSDVEKDHSAYEKTPPVVKENEDNIKKYFEDLNNHLVVTNKIYRLMNPNGKKDTPAFAFEKIKLWHNEWLETPTNQTFFDWCLINKCKITDATVDNQA